MLGGLIDRMPRFSISFCTSRPGGMITTATATEARKLVRQGQLRKQEQQQQQPEIRYHEAQQQDQDESVSFRCSSNSSSSRKKAVSWASSTVDNESTPKKSFLKECYFTQVFELNRQAYVGITPGSMQMKVVKRM